MTGRLHFTGNDEADRLLVDDAFALLVGFALDQQVPVQKAFMPSWAFARNFRLDEPEVTEFLRENVRRTFDEDKEMLEAQQANLGNGDFDPSYKVAVKADAGAVAGRRLLNTFIEAEARAVAA